MAASDDVMVKVWVPADLDTETRREYLADLQAHFDQCQGVSAALPLQRASTHSSTFPNTSG